eukprot:324334-Chlamydomonas_euryale.AAC.1
MRLPDTLSCTAVHFHPAAFNHPHQGQQCYLIACQGQHVADANARKELHQEMRPASYTALPGHLGAKLCAAHRRRCPLAAAWLPPSGSSIAHSQLPLEATRGWDVSGRTEDGRRGDVSTPMSKRRGVSDGYEAKIVGSALCWEKVPLWVGSLLMSATNGEAAELKSS